MRDDAEKDIWDRGRSFGEKKLSILRTEMSAWGVMKAWSPSLWSLTCHVVEEAHSFLSVTRGKSRWVTLLSLSWKVW